MGRRGRYGVALVAALTVLVSGCSGEPGARVAEPGSEAVAAVPDGLDARCPGREIELPYPADGTLPEGAVAVRLCNGAKDRTESGEVLNPGFQPPPDLLETDVTALVEIVNGLQPVPKDQLCTADYGPPYVYWFLYPGGDARAVSHSTSGCDDTTVAPNDLRSGGEALRTAFGQQLVTQRADLTPPGADTVPHCNPHDEPATVLPLVDSLRFDTAIYCPLLDGERWRRGVLTKRQVATLNADYAPSTGRPGRCNGHFAVIKGYTEWGDLVTMSGSCHDYFGPGAEWRPSESVRRILDGLQLGPYVEQKSLWKPAR